MRFTTGTIVHLSPHVCTSHRVCLRIRSCALLLLCFSLLRRLHPASALPASHHLCPACRHLLSGVVADPTGAIVPGAEVDLVDADGAVAVSNHSDGEGNFQVVAPHTGSFTLVVSEPGFETVRKPLLVAAPAGFVCCPRLLRIVLPIGRLATTVRVNAENSEDLTAPGREPRLLGAEPPRT